jgi:hypothetical protein
MRIGLFFSAVLVAIPFVACSGRVSPDIGDVDASAGDAAPASSDANTASDATGTVDANMLSCDQIKAQLDAMRPDVQLCCPFCNSQQCTKLADDVCCPISVTGPASKQFEDLVATYKAQCHPLCPATPCRTTGSGVCTSTDPNNPSAKGECQ